MAEHQPANYRIFCLVLDENSPFPVEIRPDATVGDLKDEMKAKKQPEFDDFAADSLTLFKVDVPALDLSKVHEQIARLDLPPTEMNPVFDLSEYYPAAPPKKTIHILARTPSIHGLKRKRGEASVDDPLQPPLKLRGKTEAPSTAGTPSKIRNMTEGPDPKIQCNRPMDDTTIPLPLLHPIFGEFVDGCGSFKPGPEENAFVSKLSHMAGYFESELKRQRFFNDTFAEYYGIRFLPQAIPGTGQTTDGHAYVSGSPTLPYIIFFVEGKNEFVNNKTDPRFQAFLYYREYVQSLYHDHKELAAGTCLPVLFMTYCGPNIQISGGVTHPDGTIQSIVLTPWFPLDRDWHDNEHWTRLAQSLGALKKSLNALSDYYKSLPNSPVPSSVPLPTSPPTLFPYPKEYKDIESESNIEFNYIQRLYRDVFLFSAKDARGRSLFIKFIQQYSVEAHQLLSSTGLAPILYGLANLPGNWIMVVMEEMKKPWDVLVKIAPEKREPFKQAIEKAVNLLHASKYVHGDIRASNILVCPSDPSQGIKFIDFDEAGLEGVVYPRNLNTKDVPRPVGAFDGQKILMEHDRWMMEQLFVPKGAG